MRDGVDESMNGSYLSQVSEAVVGGDGVSQARSSVDLDGPLVEVDGGVDGGHGQVAGQQAARRHDQRANTTTHGLGLLSTGARHGRARAKAIQVCRVEHTLSMSVVARST